MMMPQLDTQYYVTQIFWLAVFFAALYAFSAVVLLPFLRYKQHARSTAIAYNLKMAEVTLKKSKKVKRDIDEMVAKIDHDAHNIKMDAANKAQHIVEKQLELSHKVFRDYLFKAEEAKKKQMEQITERLPDIVKEVTIQLLEVLKNNGYDGIESG